MYSVNIYELKCTDDSDEVSVFEEAKERLENLQ